MKIRVLGAAAVLLVLVGCATAPGGSASEIEDLDRSVIPAPGEVRGIGTVIQIADAPPQFCLGPVAESYPPQCTGIALADWTWNDTDGHESSGDVTWGTFAVTGTWDGTTLATTGSVQLALYDPIRVEDPLLDPANGGDTSDADLVRIQDELTADPPFTVLSSTIVNGYVFVDTTYDDGQIQEHMDYRYLPDVVVIRPALTDLD